MLLAALLLAYLAVSLRHLTTVPPVYEDEPWQASTAWKLAREGVLGSDLFAGLAGMERHTYTFPPLHPLLLAAVYRVAGFGLLQTRLEPVALGLAVLLLTWALGRRLFGETVGLLAAALLLAVRLLGTTPAQLTGIPLLDFARIARYDMLVAALGLAALHVYLTASARRRPALFLAAGALAGLAGLAHLYGAAWLAVLLALAAWNRDGWRAGAALGAGFVLPALAYAPYLLAGGADLAAQTRGYAPRFGLGRPAWYLANLLAEPHRWGPGLGPFDSRWLLRPGVFAALGAVPAALLALARRSRAGEGAARAALVPAVLLPALFGLLLTLKLPNYLATVVPALAVVAAWGGVTAWRRWRGWRRLALGVAALACLAEGVARIAALEAAAARTTPYGTFIARVQAALPADGRILALHWMWFGLEDRDVRSFLVPLLRADPATSRPARPVAEALDAVAPDIVLVDRRMRAYLASPRPGDPVPGQVAAWLAARGTPIGTVEDETYGAVEVLRVRR